MAPPPAARSSGTALRAHRNVPVRLTSSVLRQASSVVSSSRLVGPDTPARLRAAGIEADDALARNEGPANILVALGYAGWGAGQLEDELAEGAWLVLDAEPADLISPRPETLWRDVLLRQTTTVALAATYRPDAEVN